MSKGNDPSRIQSLIVDSSPDAILSRDLDGRIMSWNAAAERMFAISAQAAIGHELTALLASALDETSLEYIEQQIGNQSWQVEVRLQRADGPVELALTTSPVVDSQDNVIASSTIARDISEQVAQENHRELLLQELNHRVKNVLATVQSIMMQTLGQAPEHFRQTFTKRIQALAQTHNLLTQSQWRGIDLRELIALELRPYEKDASPPWQLAGEAVALAPSQAIALGMALHELATNAAKYGALTAKTGHIEVSWVIARDHGHRVLALTWREQGGPPAEEPAQPGFGLRLIQEGMAHELDASTQLDFLSDGLRYVIRMPLETNSHDQVIT